VVPEEGVVRRLCRRLMVVVAAAFVVAACVGSAGAQQECTWGASSITAIYENGQWIVSGPETSGCTGSP
jgi:hypothetical protein